MKYKTRYQKLKIALENNIIGKTITDKDIDNIIIIFNSFEQNNLRVIEKLSKDKKIELNRIKGGLKQTINAHGNITKELIGSACKRIYGALIYQEPKKDSLINRILKWIKK